ncbi:uncharacterized protein TNCV_641031 [Trichonephila clavipes]|nr:uncharacterized protein TNCV_641031 [Trichonephila clavipes]
MKCPFSVLDLHESDLKQSGTKIGTSLRLECARYLAQCFVVQCSRRNVLTSLSEDFFSDMPDLRIVNLELNEFITIDQAIWGNVWDHLQFVNIDYSPLVCDAKIKWIYEKKEDLKRKLVALCYKPFTLFERELHTLKMEDLK